MRKFRKFFALVTALSLTASLFTGFAVTSASAAELPSFTYDGTTLKFTAAAAKKDAKLVIASYSSDGKLTGAVTDTVDITEGENTFTKTLKNGDKVFLWEGYTNLMPITGAYAMPPATPGPTPTAAPATSAPSTSAPATDAPATDAPATGAPATDAPATPTPTPASVEYLKTDFDTYSEGDYVWGKNILTANDKKYVGANNVAYKFDGTVAKIGGADTVDNVSTGDKTKGDLSYDIVTLNKAIGKVGEDLEVSFKLAKRYNGELHTAMISFNDANGATAFGIQWGVYGSKNAGQKVYLVFKDSTFELPAYTDNSWTAYDIYVGYQTASSGYIKVKIGDKEYVSPYAGTAIKSISMNKTGNMQDRGLCVDDLLVKKAASKDEYLVKYVIEETGYEAEKYVVVANGGHPAGAPDSEVDGMIFQGWTDGETTSKDLNDFTITKNTTLTATYKLDDSYIEPIVEATIAGPDSMTFGPDPDTSADNEYTLTLKGEKGTIITAANKDERVDNFKIEWDIEGFKTSNDTADQYCDSYGAMYDGDTNKEILKAEDSTATKMDFKLRNIPMNFFGKMTAKITYGKDEKGEDKVITATKYVTALGKKDADSNVILPVAGYPSSISAYDDALVDYELYRDTYGNGAALYGKGGSADAIAGGWFVSGGDGGRHAVIAQEDDRKFIKMTSAASSSHKLSHIIDSPASQAIFVQDVRFDTSDAEITLTAGYPVWQNSGYYASATLAYNGSKLTLNGTEMKKDSESTAVATKTWYKLIISTDPTSKICYAQLYDAAGETLLGETGNVAWTADTAPTFFNIGLANGKSGTINVDNYEAYYAVADESKFTLTASGETTLSIPNGDTIDLTASMITADGLEMTGAAEWSVLEADMAEGIEFGPVSEEEKNNTHKRKITLKDDAVSGEATVQVNIGGYTKTIKLELTSNAESVKFTSSATGISIPLDDTAATQMYSAVVIDKDGNTIDGRDVVLSLWKSDGTTAYSLPDDGSITFENGLLTVTKDAKAATFVIRATGKNTDNQDISRSVKVNVHGLWFDFGEGTEADVVPGYTAITPSSAYNDTNGYGIVGNVTAGGTASDSNADSDYLDGALTFKAKVQAAKRYTVEITYVGKLTAEPVNSDLTAYSVGASKELKTYTYTIPVIDDMLEMNISTYTETDDKGTEDKSDDVTTSYAPRVASIKITKNADKAAVTSNPNIYHVGDSTAANNGSWAYSLAGSSSKYTDLFGIATFYNRGAGGRNLSTYYTEGKLASVLNDIRPGDIVMFGNNGTNGMGNDFRADANYYIDAAEAMGAKIIMNSYTPHGPVGGYASNYDSATHTFNTWRTDSYDVILRDIYAQRTDNSADTYDENVLGWVEIGKNADEAFNAYVADGADDTEKDARAAEIISCFSDHNHYSKGSKARELMLDGYADPKVKGIVEQIVDLVTPYVATLSD